MDCAKKILTNKNVYTVYAIGHIRVSLWIRFVLSTLEKDFKVGNFYYKYIS